jgi:hypothetical protein
MNSIAIIAGERPDPADAAHPEVLFSNQKKSGCLARKPDGRAIDYQAAGNAEPNSHLQYLRVLLSIKCQNGT